MFVSFQRIVMLDGHQSIGLFSRESTYEINIARSRFTDPSCHRRGKRDRPTALFTQVVKHE